MPIKPLSFKGDKKPSGKKRKHHDTLDSSHQPNDNENYSSSSLSTIRRKTNTAELNQKNEPSSISNNNDEDDTSWTLPSTFSEINGPVILVLAATTPLTCLASDAHGNVFASMLENIVDGIPETAEPHDVRQVWVANTIPTTENGQMSFKASHGGFLSCDSLGVLGAKREARGLEEAFVVEDCFSSDTNGENIAGGGDTAKGKLRWRFRTAASKSGGKEKESRYLAAVATTGLVSKAANQWASTADSDETETKKQVSISLRGDGEAGSKSNEIILKMQQRFKTKSNEQKQASPAREKISRRELEQAVGRKLNDEEVKRLRRAKRDGTFYEEVLDVRVKGKHDKFAS